MFNLRCIVSHFFIVFIVYNVHMIELKRNARRRGRHTHH